MLDKIKRKRLILATSNDNSSFSTRLIIHGKKNSISETNLIETCFDYPQHVFWLSNKNNNFQ